MKDVTVTFIITAKNMTAQQRKHYSFKMELPLFSVVCRTHLPYSLLFWTSWTAHTKSQPVKKSKQQCSGCRTYISGPMRTISYKGTRAPTHIVLLFVTHNLKINYNSLLTYTAPHMRTQPHTCAHSQREYSSSLLLMERLSLLSSALSHLSLLLAQKI